MDKIAVSPLGSSGVLVTFGTAMSSETIGRVHGLVRRISAGAIDGVIDVAPAYATVGIYFDPTRISFQDLAERIEQLEASAGAATMSEGRVVEISVRYDGMDLVEVAHRCGMTADELVRRHSAPRYDVYMIGFVPGFAYLGALDPSLVLARRTPPRTRVPAGSVAIAGEQTGVYPRATPGGWHIIGTTNAVMFDATRAQPSLLAPGDTVRFVPVSV